jgi:hypothetical protein
MTCKGSNATDHVYQICPKRLETTKGRGKEQTITWEKKKKHDTPKTDNDEKNKMNAPTNNNDLKDAEHITEEGTRTDTDPECSTHADHSIPIEQEQDTLTPTTGATWNYPERLKQKDKTAEKRRTKNVTSKK